MSSVFDIYVFILVILAVLGIIRGGKNKVRRFLSGVALILVSCIVVMYLIMVHFYTIGIFGFYACFGALFIVVVYVIHHYFRGKGGEYHGRGTDGITIKTINKFKKWGLNPAAPFILGLVSLALAFVLTFYRCPTICHYISKSMECLLCNTSFFGMVAFLPIGIFFISIAYIWVRHGKRLGF